MRYIKRSKASLIKKIEKDYKHAVKKLDDHKQALIYSIEQNPQCTKWEFGKAIFRASGFPEFTTNESLVSQTMAKRKQEINHDQDIQEHIIAVPYLQKDPKTGEKYKISYLEIAKSKQAIEAAKKCKPYILGWENKEDYLTTIGNDQGYAREMYLAKKRRELLVNA